MGEFLWLRKRFYVQAGSVDLKLIIARLEAQSLVGECVVNDHYYKTTPAMVNYDFREPRADVSRPMMNKVIPPARTVTAVAGFRDR